jgi:hypothetical protein
MTTSPSRPQGWRRQPHPQGSRRPPKGLEMVEARLSLPSRGNLRAGTPRRKPGAGRGRCRWTEGREADGCGHCRGPASHVR